MSVTQVDIDDDALERAMVLSGVTTKKEAVNLALRFYADEQERAARIAQHDDAGYRTLARYAPDVSEHNIRAVT